MCCSFNNQGFYSLPMNSGCCNSPFNSYNCYYTPNCGCNNNGGFFGGFNGGCNGSSLWLIALFSLLCR